MTTTEKHFSVEKNKMSLFVQDEGIVSPDKYYVSDNTLYLSKKINVMPPEEQNSIETIKWPVWFWLVVLAVGLLGLVLIIK